MTDLFNEDKTEGQRPDKERPTDYTGHIMVAATLPVLIFFTYIGKTELGLNIGICLFDSMVAVKLRWHLRRHIWFWVVIIFVLALHAPLVLIIHWPHEWVSKFALLPIGFADCMITLGIIGFVQKFIVRDVPRDEEVD
ncbi:MAG: hypothetical protein WDM87_05005 [Terracidiphilus sp.]